MTLYRFYSWNVNGFRATIKKEEGLVKFFQGRDFHILGLQETKVNENTIPDDWRSLSGFHTQWNCGQRRGYSGVATFSTEEPLGITLGMGIEDHDKEGRIITLEFEKFFFLTCYTPNSGGELVRLDYRREWNQAFLDYCKGIEKKKPLIISGDLNVAHTEIDLANPKSNYNKTPGYTQAEIDDFTALLEGGFIDTFREFEKGGGHYSWWSYRFGAREKNVGWRLDYFLISPALRPHLKRSWIEPDVMGSDHCPVGMELEI